MLTSGLHSANYLQCALLLQHPIEAEKFGRAIAEHFKNDEIQLVASPAIGGIVIGHEVARQLGARFIWTERDNGKMTIRRGFSVTPGDRTVVVEDVITTGGLGNGGDVTRGGAKVVGAFIIDDLRVEPCWCSALPLQFGVPALTLHCTCKKDPRSTTEAERLV